MCFEWPIMAMAMAMANKSASMMIITIINDDRCCPCLFLSLTHTSQRPENRRNWAHAFFVDCFSCLPFSVWVSALRNEKKTQNSVQFVHHYRSLNRLFFLFIFFVLVLFGFTNVEVNEIQCFRSSVVRANLCSDSCQRNNWMMTGKGEKENAHAFFLSVWPSEITTEKKNSASHARMHRTQFHGRQIFSDNNNNNKHPLFW